MTDEQNLVHPHCIHPTQPGEPCGICLQNRALEMLATEPKPLPDYCLFCQTLPTNGDKPCASRDAAAKCVWLRGPNRNRYNRADEAARVSLASDLASIAERKIAQRRIHELEAALKPFAGIPLSPDDYPNTGETRDMIMAVDMTIQPSHVRAARKALK